MCAGNGDAAWDRAENPAAMAGRPTVAPAENAWQSANPGKKAAREPEPWTEMPAPAVVAEDPAVITEDPAVAAAISDLEVSAEELVDRLEDELDRDYCCPLTLV